MLLLPILLLLLLLTLLQVDRWLELGVEEVEARMREGALSRLMAKLLVQQKDFYWDSGVFWRNSRF